MYSALPPGWRDRLSNQKNNLAKIAAAFDVQDLDETAGPFEPYHSCRGELEDHTSWVPQSMTLLMKPSAFPGASVLIEHQVSAHSSIEVNAAFSKRFYTAAELEAQPWGFRRIFEIGDRGEYLASSIKECLAKRTSIGEPINSDSVINVIDQNGKSVLCYMRRYYWLEQGGRRSCTVLVLYPLPSSKHISPPTMPPQGGLYKGKGGGKGQNGGKGGKSGESGSLSAGHPEASGLPGSEVPAGQDVKYCEEEDTGAMAILLESLLESNDEAILALLGTTC